MKVNIGKYSKSKVMPKVYGPKRRVSRKALAQKATAEKQRTRKGILKKKFILYFFVTLIFVGIAAAIWKFNSFANRVRYTDEGGVEACNNIFNPTCWTEAFRPTLKQTDGFTNALIVGLDTRPVGEGSDLKNTDSIIIASINHQTKKTMLISIPRDMLVDVNINQKYCCSMKINAVYSLADVRDDVDNGLDLLAENIERMLGIDIHYKATINFEAVKDAVDAIGGIDIHIDDNLVVDYPDDEPPYKHIYVEFKEGDQHLDGKNALIWGRFRYVYTGPNEYGTDFSRARRQQQVLKALKDKILKDESPIGEKATKYWSVYQSISNNFILENTTPEDALAAVSLITDYDLNPVDVVLDPNIGGLNNYIITNPREESYGYHIGPKDATWSKVREYLDLIWEYSDIYREQAVITVVNRSGIGFGTDSKAVQLQNSDVPFTGLFLISAQKLESGGVTIVDFSGGTKSKTIDYLKEYFGTENVISDPQAAGIEKSGYLEDIKVEIGPEETSAEN